MKHKMKKAFSWLLALALILSLVPGMTLTASAAENSTDYTLTIPSTLNVADSGWNATTGITAAVKSGDTFDTTKKLTVTATSKNSWALKSGNNSIGYNLAIATGTYNSTATPASWEFSAAELNNTNGTNKTMGIIVEDYTSAAPGTYQDVVTFTAKVETAAVAVTGVTLDKTTATLTVGGGTETLTATVAPADATNNAVTWTSSNESVATVANGVVTPVAAGTATITVTTTDGSFTATCAVTVVNPVTYTVSFNANGGTGTMADVTGVSGNYTLPTCTFTAPGSLNFVGWYVGSATTVTAAGASVDISADTTIKAVWVTYTSLSANTVLRTGDTFYTGGSVSFDTKPAMSFNASNGVITVVEDGGYYKLQRGSNNTKANVKSFKVAANTDGIYITGGAGTSSNKFTLAVHTKE